MRVQYFFGKGQWGGRAIGVGVNLSQILEHLGVRRDLVVEGIGIRIAGGVVGDGEDVVQVSSGGERSSEKSDLTHNVSVTCSEHVVG